MRVHRFAHGGRHWGMPAAVTAAVAAVLLVGGCAGSGTEAPAAGRSSAAASASPAAVGVVLAVTGTEYSFGPEALTASAGSTTIRFTNNGAMEHDLSIDALGVKLTAQPGKSAEATVTLKPGTYTSYCSVPGHRQSGMRATLTVS